MTTGVDTLQFQAETRQLLNLVINTIYSNPDVFLRELVSNAADALAKLRLDTFRDKELDADISDLHITIEVDRERRTLAVKDNGIGMTYHDVVQFVGTIAKSGTAESLLAEHRSGEASMESTGLIGQFGVGFYSTFMVADKVVMVTRRAGAERAVRWESHGDGEYTIEFVDEAPQGTSVTLYLKPDAGEADNFDVYLNDSKIREIVRRYSDFLPWPIRMEVDSESDDGSAVRDIETINSMTALWSRPRGEVTDAEYHELYRHISHDWAEPLATLTFKAEGTMEYDAVLFIPSRAPFDMFRHDARRGLQLYVRRVHILDNCDALMSDYLRFINGVVDAHDLSLNLSRETLQHDRRVHAIRRRLVKKVLSSLRDIMTDDPTRYSKIWSEFGSVLKEGLLVDPDNRPAILDLLRFQSTMDDEDPTSLQRYVERMASGQDAIYYLLGESRALVEHSPHLEALREQGLEVLLLTDSIDPMVIDAVSEFAGKPLRSAASSEVGSDGGEEDEAAEPYREEERQQYSDLLSWMATVLADRVKEVRLSARLTTSAVRVVSDPDDPASAWSRSYRAGFPGLAPSGRILELNPRHELVTGLKTAFASSREVVPGADLVELTELLYGVAVIADGAELDDPSRYARLLSSRLARTL
jgi:molecular chaperone HtpG